MQKSLCLALLFGFLMTLGLAFAQMPQPATVTYYSDNRRYFVLQQPKLSKITVYELQGPGKDPKYLWSTFGDYREIAIADDGQHMMGSIGNIIPTQYREDMVVMTFMDKGKPIRNVRLKHVMHDYTKLVRTKKGQWVWGFFRGFDRAGNYVIETVEKKNYVFNMKTGTIVSSKSLERL